MREIGKDNPTKKRNRERVFYTDRWREREAERKGGRERERVRDRERGRERGQRQTNRQTKQKMTRIRITVAKSPRQ